MDARESSVVVEVEADGGVNCWRDYPPALRRFAKGRERLAFSVPPGLLQAFCFLNLGFDEPLDALGATRVMIC